MLWRNDSVIIYFHNIKYDAEFQKSVFKKFEDIGYTAKYVLRNGSPIKISFEQGEKLIEFRDSFKKVPSALKQVGKMMGVSK